MVWICVFNLSSFLNQTAESKLDPFNKFFYNQNGARSMGPMQRLLLTVTKLNNKLSTEGKC